MKTVDLAIAERVLGNGMTVLAVQNPGVATCAASVFLPIGRLNELPDEHGLAHLTGACLDEGTRRRSAAELAEAVENIGGALTAAAGGASIQSPAEEAARAVRLLRECVTEPAFPAREVRRVQHEIVADIEAELEDPRDVARRRFHALVYGEHPFARPVQGTPEAIERYRPADLRRFHRKWFVPAGAIAAIAGPMEPAEGLDLLAKAFRSFRGRAVEPPGAVAPSRPERRVEEHIPMPREQTHVFLGHVGVRRDDADYYALLVMDHVLGSGPGFTSRITRRLRDDMGLCYSVFATITRDAGKEPGAFTAYIGTSAEHRKAAIAAFREEIARIRTTLPSAAELADVQEYLTGSFVLRLERNSNLVAYAIGAKRFGLGYDHIHRYPELIAAVTREDVRRVAQQHLDPERVVIVSAGAG